MDQFEAARQKTLKREARNARYSAGSDFNVEGGFIKSAKDEDHAIQVPKEKSAKPQKNGIFTISVDMPHAQFTFTLVKQSILSHAPQNRLTEAEIRKHIIQGLKPLLGGLD